jgi:hypothetical protein
LSEDEWTQKIRKMKEDTEREIRDKRIEEEELREKYKDEKTEIMELLRLELAKVVEVFKDPSKNEWEQPKVEVSEYAASLNVPIVEMGTRVNTGISFYPQLTDNGYTLKVLRGNFDGMYEQSYETISAIYPPVTTEAIQKEVTAFLESRSHTIKRMEQRSQKLRRIL